MHEFSLIAQITNALTLGAVYVLVVSMVIYIMIDEVVYHYRKMMKSLDLVLPNPKITAVGVLWLSIFFIYPMVGVLVTIICGYFIWKLSR